jgi:hypothetical protein
MKLKKYCITVMDCWTPTREFWTFGGALKHWVRHQPGTYSHFYVWHPDWKEWVEIFKKDPAQTSS